MILFSILQISKRTISKTRKTVQYGEFSHARLLECTSRLFSPGFVARPRRHTRQYVEEPGEAQRRRHARIRRGSRRLARKTGQYSLWTEVLSLRCPQKGFCYGCLSTSLLKRLGSWLESGKALLTWLPGIL